MQAVAVAKITSQAPVGAGGGASDTAAAEGMDFAALLAAQFQGVGEAGIEAPLQADVAVLDTKVEVAQDFKAEAVPLAQAPTPTPTPTPTSIDPVLQAMAMMPGAAPVMQVMQQVAQEIKPVLPALSDKLPGNTKVSEFSGLLLDEESAGKDKALLLARDGAAEFAAGGKSSPSGDANFSDTKFSDAKFSDTKLIDTSKFSTLPADVPRVPDASSAVSSIMNASQSRAASEIKMPLGYVQPPVGASGWGDALGQKVVWMAGQQQQVAELHLNPPNLGPMEVRLTISNDQISAQFVSHQPAVREAIEAAMPRLREMFADSGMTLGNASVSSDSLPQRQNSGQEGQSGAKSNPDFPLVDGYAMPMTARGIMQLPGDGRGMVDLFA